MSEHKKKFYQVPFNDALVGFLYILAYAMYFEGLPILYRKIVDPFARFDITWLFYTFALGAFGLAISVMPLWNVANKLQNRYFSVLCRCLGVIIGIPFAVLIAIPMIHFLTPYYIARFFLKITGLTTTKESKKRKQNQKGTEQVNRTARNAQQHFEKLTQEKVRQRTIQQIRDYAKSLGFSYIPSMEEFKHVRNAYLKRHHPDNGGTNEEFIRAQKEMENMEEIVKIWHAGHLYDDAKL